MISRVIAASLALAVVTGLAYRAWPHTGVPLLRSPGEAALVDERMVDVALSPYADVSWITSPSSGWSSLRLGNTVQGIVTSCPGTTWPEILPYAPHLAVAGVTPEGPGTIPGAGYAAIAITGLVTARQAITPSPERPLRVLVIGTGAGSGPLVLAHHEPYAAIDVIDIDAVVNDMALRHIPLLRALDREALPRIRMHTADGRRFLRGVSEPYDLIFLDAYGGGSDVPSHLATAEFLNECQAVLSPQGVIMANIIGSVSGRRQWVLRGLVATAETCGLSGALIPVMHDMIDGPVDQASLRNLTIVWTKTAVRPVDPEGWLAGWAASEPFPGVPLHPDPQRFSFGVDGRGNAVGLAVPWQTDWNGLVGQDAWRPLPAAPQGAVAYGPGGTWYGMVPLAGHEPLAAAMVTAYPTMWRSVPAYILLAEHDSLRMMRAQWRSSVRPERILWTADLCRIAQSAQGSVGPGTGLFAHAPIFTDSRPMADMGGR
jgi:hypothetical protein